MSIRSSAQTVVFAGSMTMPPAPERFELRTPPAVFQMVRHLREPLELDADVFIYRVLPDRQIVPINPHLRARICRRRHRR